MTIRNTDGTLACICHEHRPVCDCVIAAPPLVPVVPLTIAQLNFLTLHTRHIVMQWQWHFCETQLRASTERRTATIWRVELDDLVQRGLITKSHGESVRVTAAGREAAKEKEQA